MRGAILFPSITRKDRTLIDQLIIGDKASFDDFGASLSARTIKQPAKKSIKETVPFSNITYDFSAINGEVYWEERELEYSFEMIAPMPEELERAKISFANWIMNITEEVIYDPFIPDYHFKGTFDSIDFSDEDNIEKTTAKVVFKAYPYKIANVPKKYTFTLRANSTKYVSINNESSHRITPTFTLTGGSLSVYLNDTTYSFAEGEVTDEAIKINAGVSAINFINVGTTATEIMITFYEEVF